MLMLPHVALPCAGLNATGHALLSEHRSIRSLAFIPHRGKALMTPAPTRDTNESTGPAPNILCDIQVFDSYAGRALPVGPYRSSYKVEPSV